MAQDSSSDYLGPYVRLEGVSISQLPTEGRGTSQSTSSSPTPATDLKDLISHILSEAVPFIDTAAPKSGKPTTWMSKGSAKRYSSSESPVYSSFRVVSGKDIDKIAGMDKLSADRRDETWFCRRSVHRNAGVKGTAKWEEFKSAFKENHAQTEKAFTSNIMGAREAIVWDTRGIEVEADGGRWIDAKLAMVEMKHRITPKPLNDRTFPVLQLSASLAGTQEFIVVSIPVMDFSTAQEALYSKDKGIVVAAYVAVERIRVLPQSGDIEWIMATASNAGGVLPQWMQNLAVPGKLTEDVDMFMSWIRSQRGESVKQAAKEPSMDNGQAPAQESLKTTS